MWRFDRLDNKYFTSVYPQTSSVARHMQVGKKIRLISSGLSYRLISPNTVSFQMGFSAGSSSLSDKTRYPLFFRVNAPETILYTAVVSLLHRFNWKRIAIVKQDEDLFNEVGENSPY